jgi:uncharacterized protein YxjI
MLFPVAVTFRLTALAHEVRVVDATGSDLGYIKAQPHEYRSTVKIHSDAGRMNVIYTVAFDPHGKRHRFMLDNGQELGFVAREADGLSSCFIIGIGSDQTFDIRPQRGFIAATDRMISLLPVLRLLFGQVFAPGFDVRRIAGNVVAVVTKRPVVFGSRYTVELAETISGDEQAALILAVVLISVLDRY